MTIIPNRRPRSAPQTVAATRPRILMYPGAVPAPTMENGISIPRKAPTLMIPSQPRLKIPAFWLNISPMEAIIRVTAKRTVSVSVFTMKSMSCLLF